MARIISAGVTSVTIGSKCGLTMLRGVTTFSNRRNHLQDVSHSILRLQTGRGLLEPSAQFYMEPIRRSARSAQRTSRRSLTDLRTNRRWFGVRRVVATDHAAAGVACSATVARSRTTSSPAGPLWARPSRSVGRGRPAGSTRPSRGQ